MRLDRVGVDVEADFVAEAVHREAPRRGAIREPVRGQSRLRLLQGRRAAPRGHGEPEGRIVARQVRVVLVLRPPREQEPARHRELHQRVGREVLRPVVEHPRKRLAVAQPVRDLAHHEGARIA